MQISSVSLQQFRSYKKQTVLFSQQVTVIVGPNAAGKTNVLEAIYTLSTGKSFRAEKDSDMIFWGSEIGRINGKILNPKFQSANWRTNKPQNPNTKYEETALELVITTGEVQGQKAPAKKYIVNGVARRLVDFAGNLLCVHFCPEDLDIVTDSPSLRRSYMNAVLSQADREYRRNLQSYERGLRQRNRILEAIREGQATRNQLLFWDQLLIKAGSYITEARARFIDHLNSYVLDDLHFEISYDKSEISHARLEQYKEEEVAAATTLVGPQRDDMIFYMRRKNEKQKRDVSRFGSRGEQRLNVLWLKLAELYFLETVTGRRPVLLLDDIFSELDETSGAMVLDIIDKQQTVITSADEELIQKMPKTINIIRVPF